jgi:Outer membrane lipoprotein carrier protein LolA
MRAFFLSFIALASAYPQAASLPKPDPALPPIMEQWAEAQKSVGDMEVAFQQTRTIPALKQPVTTQGKFWRFTDGAFRWEIGKPVATVLVHDLKEFRVRESTDAPWQVLQEDDARYRMWARFLSGREASPKEISRHFGVKEAVDSPGITTVSLQPKALLIRRYLNQLDLQISQATKLLVQLRVVQGDGTTVLMRFAEPKAVSAETKTKLLAR